MKQIQQQKADEEARRHRDKLRYERKMEEERAKEREILKKRMAAELNKSQQNNQNEVPKLKESPINSSRKDTVVEMGDQNPEVIDNSKMSAKHDDTESELNDSKSDIPRSTNDLNADANKESKRSYENKNNIKELELDIKSDKSLDIDKDFVDSDNSPSFAESSDGTENIVNDESTTFRPNVLIQRQSKGKQT